MDRQRTAAAAVEADPTGPDAAGPELDYLEAFFLAVFASFLLTSWLGFTLAEVGQDRPLAVLGAGAALLVGLLAWIGRRRWRPVGPGAVAAFLVPLVIGALLFFPPDEWILGGLDPGSYVGGGAAIARGGGIVIRDPAFARLAPVLRRTLLSDDANRLPGFYAVFPRFVGLLPRGFAFSPDRAVPHGFHLYPVVLAFGYALGGIRAELMVTPLLALLGLGGFFLFARRLFGTAVGLLAAVFLAVGPAEVWFARYPAAEILAQALLFGGFLALVAAADAGGRALAALAGLALGAVHLAKIEMLPLPFLVAAFLLVRWLARGKERIWWWFAVPYLLLLIQAAVHAALIAAWYSWLTLGLTVSGRLLAAGGTAALLLALAALLLRLRPDLRCRLRRAAAGPPAAAARLGASLAVGLAALYAYYVRPFNAAALLAGSSDPGRLAAVNALESVVRLGWFVTPLGLLLGTVGGMLIVRRELDARTLLPWLAVAADCLIFLTDPRITPLYYWAARRWVPLVIPGVCLAAAYAVVRLLPDDFRRWTAALLPAACGAAVLLELLRATHPLLGYVEYRGAVAQVGALAGMVPPSALVLFPDGDVGQRLSVPFEYLFERTSIVVAATAREEAAAGQAAREWLAEGRPAYWISTPDGPPPQTIGLAGQVAAERTIWLPEKRATRDVPPGENGEFRATVVIWRLAAPPGAG